MSRALKKAKSALLQTEPISLFKNILNRNVHVNQLRELEQDGIIERTIYAEIPPRVEYKISTLGETLFPIIDAMSDWGLNSMNLKTC